jgi:hypothetical protein
VDLVVVLVVPVDCQEFLRALEALEVPEVLLEVLLED